MSEFRWRGNGEGTKSDPKDGRNWIDGSGSGYAESRYPGSIAGVFDDIVFDAALTGAASSPAGSATQSMDFSSDEAWASLRIGKEYDGSIGGTVDEVTYYLGIECTDVSIDASAASNIYVEGVNAGLTNVNLRSGTGVYLDGTLGNVTAIDGIVEISDTATISTSLIIGSSSASTLDLTILEGATIPSTVYCNSGSISNGNTISGTLYVNGGTWTQTAGDIANVRVNNTSGKLIWNDGNIATAYLLAGELDGSGSASSRRIDNAYVYPDGALNLNDGVGNIVITGKVTNYGGMFSSPTGAGLLPYTNVTYSGTSDAKYGIAPQTINDATVNGDGVYLAENDKLEIYCACGAIDSGGAVSFAAYEDDASDFSGESTVSGKSESFTDSDDNKAKKVEIWGYELSVGKPWVRIKAIESGVQNALVSASYRTLRA